jgi:nucleoside-diphosphate-sugar epimerase
MIFILGGNGFVGSAFARLCRDRGLEFAIIDRSNYSQFVGRNCDIFINAAGNSKKFLTRQTPLLDFDASVRTVRASLNDFPCNTYVLISSADVYPDSSSTQTTSESQFLDVAKMTPYGFHKHLAELCVRHSASRWLIARCGGFVGPLIKKNPIFDIINGGPLWISEESELQYIHTDQSASIILGLVHLGIQNEIFNISGSGVVRLSKVMEWTSRSVLVSPDSPFFRCEMNLDKVSSFLQLPETQTVVRDFIVQNRML